MRAVAALAAMILLLLVGPFVRPAPAAPPLAAAALRLDVEEFGPRVVTADGPGVLSVVATLTNTGSQAVSELGVRVQRGDPLTGEGEVRDALRGAAAADAAVPQFVDLPGELAPGATIPVRLAVPLRAATGLALSRPGVYELLVNVNGTPAGGDRARLAAARMLLPVVSLPPTDPGSATPAPVSAVPVPFTLLYPIADMPRRLATVPGEPALLTDDELATSFAPGGRLYGLVEALAERAPTGSRVRAGMCVAVDANLVATAAAMSAGYQVRGPDGTTTPGAGADAAKRWLDLLATTVRDGCLLALPLADADLVALTRGNLADLAGRAVSDGRTVLARTLGVPVLPATTWPADGVLDERTLARSVAPTGRSVVLSADGLAASADRVTGVLPVSGADRPQLAVLADPLLIRAATGPQGTPSVPGDGPEVRPITIPAGTGTPLSTQDLIGALAFRARTVESTPDPLVLAPPHQWAVDQTSAAALLTAVDQLIGAGLLGPRPFEQVVAAGIPASGSQRLAYPLRAGAREIPQDVVATVATTRASVDDLRSAAVEHGSVGVTVDNVFDPLVQGLVRPTSGAFRGRAEAAVRAAATDDARIQELRAAVRVIQPPSPYALGTTDAPLLLTVANGLPISMRVRVALTSSGGLDVDPIPEQEIPPLGRRQIQVSAEVTRSGQFTVDAAVRTPDGGQLGPVSRLRVRSTGYGTITVWLTGIAGVLLVVLSARRVLRRIRGETDPAPPLPDPQPTTPDAEDCTTRLPSLPPATTSTQPGPASADPATRPLVPPSPRRTTPPVPPTPPQTGPPPGRGPTPSEPAEDHPTRPLAPLPVDTGPAAVPPRRPQPPAPPGVPSRRR